MTNERYPWRVQQSVAEVIATHRAFFNKVQLTKRGGGYAESKLRAFEKKSGRELPPDIRALYSAVRFVDPDDVTAEFDVDFSFDPPEHLRWMPLSKNLAAPDDDWSSAEGLIFGEFGDEAPLMWVRGHRTHNDGIIVVAGFHNLSDLQFVTLARSLTEFLGKVVYFRGIQPGGANDAALHEKVYGASGNFPRDLANDSYEARLRAAIEKDMAAVELFKAELAELNSPREERPSNPRA